MITLTSDKLALVKARLSIKDLVHQRLSVSGTSHPPERHYKVMLAYTVQRDETGPVRRLYTHACQL
jgi:hypothetical protein